MNNSEYLLIPISNAAKNWSNTFGIASDKKLNYLKNNNLEILKIKSKKYDSTIDLIKHVLLYLFILLIPASITYSILSYLEIISLIQITKHLPNSIPSTVHIFVEPIIGIIILSISLYFSIKLYKLRKRMIEILNNVGVNNG